MKKEHWRHTKKCKNKKERTPKRMKRMMNTIKRKKERKKTALSQSFRYLTQRILCVVGPLTINQNVKPSSTLVFCQKIKWKKKTKITKKYYTTKSPHQNEYFWWRSLRPMANWKKMRMEKKWQRKTQSHAFVTRILFNKTFLPLILVFVVYFFSIFFHFFFFFVYAYWLEYKLVQKMRKKRVERYVHSKNEFSVCKK